MSNKIILIAFVAIIGLAVLGITGLFVQEKRATPRPVVMIPEPPPTPSAITPPAPNQPECNTSQRKVSTSTWPTYKNRNWEFTFQYPIGWKVEEHIAAGVGSYLNISGDSHLIHIVKDVDGVIGEEIGAYKFCSRTIAGQVVGFYECDDITYICHAKYDYASSPTFYRYFKNFNFPSHYYWLWVKGPLSSTEITDAVLNTVELVKN